MDHRQVVAAFVLPRLPLCHSPFQSEDPWVRQLPESSDHPRATTWSQGEVRFRLLAVFEALKKVKV